MKASTINWHVKRDNNQQLAAFCERNKTRSMRELFTRNDGQHQYWQMTYTFDNGGYITAELLHGDDKRGYTTADHFAVLAQGLGA